MKFIKTLNRGLLRLFSIQNWLIWIFLSVVINIVFFYYNLGNLKIPEGKLFEISGDAIQYVSSAENVYQGKDFTFFKTNDKDYIFFSNAAKDFDKGIYYAFRMPGFAFIYIPLRYIFSLESTLMLIVLLQVLLSAVSKYIFALLCYKLIKKKVVFYVLIAGVNLTGYMVLFNNYLFTESFALSFLIFSIYLFYKFLESRNKWSLFFSGLFLMELIFLRPFMAPFYLFFVTILFIYLRPKIRQWFIYTIVFSSSLVLAESIWVVRNYLKTKELIVLAASTREDNFRNKSVLEQFVLTRHCGITCEWWINESPVKWFRDSLDHRKPETVFPRYIFSNGFNQESMIMAKKSYLLSKDTLLLSSVRLYNELLSAQLIRNIRNNYNSNYPIRYHLLSRFKLLVGLINQPLVRSLTSIRYPLNVISTFLDALICYFIFIWGSLSLVWYFFQYRRNFIMLLLGSVPIFILFLFPFVIQSMEHREMTLAFPFLFFVGVCNLTEIRTRPLLKKIYVFSITIAFTLYAIYYTVNHIRW